MRLLPLLFTILLAGCSLYKSTSRKEFESASPGDVVPTAIVYSAAECVTSAGPLPSAGGEILVNQPSLRVTKLTGSDGEVRIVRERLNSGKVETCHRDFANEAALKAALSTLD